MTVHPSPPCERLSRLEWSDNRSTLAAGNFKGLTRIIGKDRSYISFTHAEPSSLAEKDAWRDSTLVDQLEGNDIAPTFHYFLASNYPSETKLTKSIDCEW